MSIKIGSARIDERGKASGGKIGDNNKREVIIGSWYDHPWNLYAEPADLKLAEKAASNMEGICKNDKIGYDQSQRTTAYESIAKNIKLGMSIEKAIAMAEGETDCSDCVSTCYKLAGVNISVDNTTSTLRKALTALGFKIYTDADHVASDKYAIRGGIYLSENRTIKDKNGKDVKISGHVVMALENGIERLTVEDAQDYYFNEGTSTDKFDMLLIKSLQILRIKAFTVEGAIIEWSHKKLKDGTPVIGDKQGMIDDLAAYKKDKNNKISQSRIDGFLIKSVKYLKEGGK